MKTSFSTLACPEWSFEAILGAAAQYGFDGVELRVVACELDLWKLPEFQPSVLAESHKRVKDTGVQVVCIDSSACFHSQDAAERERNVDSALRMAEIAEGLGAPAVRVFPDCIQSGRDREETEGWIVESLVALAGKLESSKVDVWLETHGDFAVTGAVSEILRGLRREDVGIIWDPANAFLQNGESPALSAEMEAHLRHVHVKDFRRGESGEMQYVANGEGVFPFDVLFAELERVGYDGFVSFEWEKQWHPELAAAGVALPQFMQWWQR